MTNFDQTREQDPAASWSYRSLKKSTLKELSEKIGEDTGVDPKRIRLWSMVNRQNKTTRPDTPVPEGIITVEDAQQRLAGNKAPELRLWAEIAEESGPDGEPIWPTPYGMANGTTPKSDLIVLFLKHFDPETQRLRGIGHIYIGREKKVEDLVPAIMKKMDWPEKSPTGDKVQLRLFEVGVYHGLQVDVD